MNLLINKSLFQNKQNRFYNIHEWNGTSVCIKTNPPFTRKGIFFCLFVYYKLLVKKFVYVNSNKYMILEHFLFYLNFNSRFVFVYIYFSCDSKMKPYMIRHPKNVHKGTHLSLSQATKRLKKLVRTNLPKTLKSKG